MQPENDGHKSSVQSEVSNDSTVNHNIVTAPNNEQEKTPAQPETPIDPLEEARLQKAKRTKRILTFLGLQISLFLAALDSTIVATALPRIGSDFNKMDIVSWVATAYILTFDAFQPLFSKFSDIFGRKLVLIFGICLFLFGSILCGAAKSIVMLIIFRAVSGIGGAGIFSMVFVIISDIVPLEKRGSYQGLINAVFAMSSIFGPLIGGSFTEYVSWRWNFYINLPIGGAALAVLFFFLDLPVPKGKLIDKLKRVDYVGTVIVLSFSTLFLLALNFGGQAFPWKSAAVIAPLVISIALVGLLCLVESKFAKEPLMPPRLFKNRSVLGALLTNWFFGMSFLGMLYYLPVYFQVVRHDTAMWSGIRLIPMQMIVCTVSTSTGFLISKTGRYRPLLSIGLALLSLCLGLLSLFDKNTSWSRVYGFTIIGGLGMGCMFASSVIALQAAVEKKDIAVVTGLGSFSRILGGALGVAIASTIVNSTLTQDLPLRIPSEQAQQVLQSSAYVHNGLPEEYLDTVLEVYTEGLQLVWHVLTGMAGAGFISSLFIKHHEMRKRGPPIKEEEKTPTDEIVIPPQENIEGAVIVDVADTKKEEPAKSRL
ncbi:major facilitator superfamily domain-containing protein [Phycomyces blakesleeanus]|uniref:Major facilitator superfamily (MFS) profile domain-containing protein n=2 Tax=Phycomyces blakesleeanus TaxID=4837 RepID=A0A162PLX6_PHYB8|nr:hypothetical protein PHYBLDRAFT_148722 [Phycomyces blakesleeanus NRRL 1555(-)]OAD70166.1 hypothetical protein PHYBLDRAFT_148722 [Phycomyces blakesleeanus NRRL 1555(-)]|eukprot:XP_018288206.1 hypothetical protein PHYBLDRAFT_148722 [Phycomyces blakesleeanus NRRL 1555(-)]